MKTGFVTLAAMLLLVHTVVAQDCIRQQTTAITVNVNWCHQPATAVLDSPIGYCANVRCKSSHKTHYDVEEVRRGMYCVNVIMSRNNFVSLYAGCCRALQSSTSVAPGVTVTCPNGDSRIIDVRYTDIQSCECDQDC